MTTLAEIALRRWREERPRTENFRSWLLRTDLRCRVEGYLYTSYCRIIFRDGSVALFANEILQLAGRR